MNKKKILITGSSGFIGFSLALKLLKKGHKILGYDSINDYYDVNLKFSRNRILKTFKNFSFIKGELEDRKTLNKNVLSFRPEIIIHLAPKREKELPKKRERKIRQSQKIKKIYRERLDIPVNKYLMVDASTNTDVQNEVLSSLPSDNQEYVYLA